MSDFDLVNYIKSERLIVDPIYRDTIRENGIDMRIGAEIRKILDSDIPFDPNIHQTEEWRYKKEEGLAFTIQPGERILCRTQEWIELPKDLLGFCSLRVTWALLGITIPPTIVDAGFKGTLTIEMINNGKFPVKFYYGDRFMHVVFAKTTSIVEKPYEGKYQGQVDVQPPIMDHQFRRN